MDKQHIISLIEEQLATGKISREDLLILAHKGIPLSVNTDPVFNSNMADTSHKEESSKNLINTFYLIGAIIVLVGVVIFVGQNWNDIGFMSRIIVTLGISLVLYIGAFLFDKPFQRVISQVMFIMSSALAPLGVYVLLSEANVNFAWPYTLYITFILSALFGYALWATKKNILVLITIGFASWAYYVLIVHFFTFDYSLDVLKWASMFLGFSYVLIAQGYRSLSTAIDVSDEKEKSVVREVLLGLGTLAILGSGISIGGIFDLVFVAFIFAAFYGSVYLKSRSMLMFGALFLMAHIVKLTSQYFVDSIGWPVALIVVGFLVIGVGYMTYTLNKKYISKK